MKAKALTARGKIKARRKFRQHREVQDSSYNEASRNSTTIPTFPPPGEIDPDNVEAEYYGQEATKQMKAAMDFDGPDDKFQKQRHEEKRRIIEENRRKARKCWPRTKNFFCPQE